MVRYDVPANTVRKNDYQDADKTVSVLNVERKTKYVYISWSDSVTSRHEIERQVTIWRDELTKEEQNEALIKDTKRAIESWMVSQRDNLTKAQAKVMGIVTGDKYLSHWEVEEIWAAQAEYKLAEQVRNIYQDPGVGLIQAYLHVTERVTDDIVNSQFSSRSNLSVSNAEDDVIREVKARFVRSWVTQMARMCFEKGLVSKAKI